MDMPERRARRSSLLVPGSSLGQVRGAGRLPADEVILDLAGVERSQKDTARDQVAEALAEQSYGEQTVTVRVNAVDTMWAYRDVVDVVERAGEFVDCVAIPRVSSPGDVEFVDNLLRMIEERIDLGHRIGVAAEISNAQGLTLRDEIAIASDRLEALVLDENGVAASLGAATPTDTATDRWLGVRTHVLIAARAAGLQAIVAPATDKGEPDAYRAELQRSRALGYDGAWCVHPDQLPIANEVLTLA